MPKTVPHALAETEFALTARVVTDGATTTFVELEAVSPDLNTVPGMTGIARCAPHDRFDAETGFALALTRALRGIADELEGAIPEADRDVNRDVAHITKRFHQMNRERQHWRDRYAELLVKNGYQIDGNDPDSNLVRHARMEMSRIGLYDEDADYGGMLAQAVEDLIRMFAAQGHSGGSAFMVRELFNQLTNFEPLSPLTDDPSEWMHIEEGMAGSPDLYQSRRRPDAFSNDGGKTYRLVGDTDDTTYTSEPHTPPEVADAPHAAEPAS